jgi:hypothetical protein
MCAHPVDDLDLLVDALDKIRVLRAEAARQDTGQVGIELSVFLLQIDVD